MIADPKSFLRALFDEAVAAADPARVVPSALPQHPSGRTVVIGAGKASAAMAKALEEHWDAPLEGLVVTRYGHAVPCQRIEIVEAAHPVPDRNGVEAARRMLNLVSGLTEEDLVICLISGGGSSLLSLPAGDISLDEKRAVTGALLRSGANISEMNCVRKHLSAVKGGRLAAACRPARVVSLLISDVPGDDPSVIASGPTVPDPTTCEDARRILSFYGIEVPRSVSRWLASPQAETPKPGDHSFASDHVDLVARPIKSIEAAARAAMDKGVTPLFLGDAIEGEAREVGTVMAGIARSVREHGLPLDAPCVLLSGGETTVTVRGDGRGGRNTEFLLGLMLALDGMEGVYGLACDTDGIDGTEENAGAMIDPTSISRAVQAGLDPAEELRVNDAYGVFYAINDLVVSGPTLTNVNDFRAILIL